MNRIFIFLSVALISSLSFAIDSGETKFCQNGARLTIFLKDNKEIPKNDVLYSEAKTVVLHGTSVHALENIDILNTLPRLEEIIFHEECGLREVPPHLDRLKNIKSISFENNPIRYVPKNIMKLFIKNPDLQINLRNTFLSFEDDDTGKKLGFLGLKKLSRFNIVIPQRFSLYGSMPIFSENLAYNILAFHENLQGQSIYLNPAKMRESRVPPFEKSADCNKETFFAEFSTLLNSFDLENSESEHFVLFDYFEEAFVERNPSFSRGGRTNKELMTTLVFPLLRGFAKALWDLPIDEENGERAGAQPVDIENQESIKQVLFKVLWQLNRLKDPQEKTAKFSQLKGLLFCMEGYVEALNSLLYNDTTWKKDKLGLETKVQRIIAAEKQEKFPYAVTHSQFNQSAHQMSYYTYYLAHVLGIETSMPGYQEIHNIYSNSFLPVGMFEANTLRGRQSDYFVDSMENDQEVALTRFYQEFFGFSRIASLLVDSFETHDDNKMAHEFSLQQEPFKNLKKMKFDLKELRNQYALEREKERVFWQRKKEIQQSAAEKEYDRLKEISLEDARAFEENFDAINLLMAQEMESLKKIDELHLNLIATKIKEIEAMSAELQGLIDLGRRVSKNHNLRPLSFGDLFVFLKEKNLVGEYNEEFQTYPGLEKFVAINSIKVDEYGEPYYASLSLSGAKRLLTLLGYFIEEPLLEAIDDCVEIISSCIALPSSNSLMSPTELAERHQEELNALLLASYELGSLLETELEAIEDEYERKARIEEFEEEERKKMNLLEQVHAKEWQQNNQVLVDEERHPIKFALLFSYLKKQGHLGKYCPGSDTYENFGNYFDEKTIRRDQNGDIIYAQISRNGAFELMAKMHLMIEDNNIRKGIINQILEQIQP